MTRRITGSKRVGEAGANNARQALGSSFTSRAFCMADEPIIFEPFLGCRLSLSGSQPAHLTREKDISHATRGFCSGNGVAAIRPPSITNHAALVISVDRDDRSGTGENFTLRVPVVTTMTATLRRMLGYGSYEKITRTKMDLESSSSRRAILTAFQQRPYSLK